MHVMRQYAPQFICEKTADDAAREFLFSTASERGAHAVAVHALLARNASSRTNDELTEEELGADPAFRSEWKRTTLGRAVATALVRYRAKQDPSQRELAETLQMTRREIARLKVGDVDPSQHALTRISTELGSGAHHRAWEQHGTEASARRMIARENTSGRSEPIQ